MKCRASVTTGTGNQSAWRVVGFLKIKDGALIEMLEALLQIPNLDSVQDFAAGISLCNIPVKFLQPIQTLSATLFAWRMCYIGLWVTDLFPCNPSSRF